MSKVIRQLGSAAPRVTKSMAFDYARVKTPSGSFSPVTMPELFEGHRKIATSIPPAGVRRFSQDAHAFHLGPRSNLLINEQQAAVTTHGIAGKPYKLDLGTDDPDKMDLASSVTASKQILKARRPYQIEAIAAVIERAVSGNRRQLIILPTGTGKTLIAEQIAKELLVQPKFAGGRVLIIAPTGEIANQNALGFNAGFAGEVGVLHSEKKGGPAYNDIKFSSGVDPGTRVVSATIQSLMAMGDSFDWSGFSVVIADEAHHYVPGNEGYFLPFQRLGFFDEQNNYLNPEGRILLGFTATPDRLDNQPGSRLVDVYGQDAIGVGCTRDINYFTQGLGGEQYLRQPHQIGVSIEGHTKDGCKLTGCEAWRGLAPDDKALVIAKLFYDHPDLSRDDRPKRTIFYVADIAEAEAMEVKLQAYGLNAFAVTGKTVDRSQKIQKFRESEFDILIGVGIPKEGFDVPGVEVVMLFGADTESRGQVVQMIGRALRMDPAHPDRKQAYVVDPWNLGDKHDIQMRGEVAYELFGEAPGAVGESQKPKNNTRRTPAQVTSFTWEGVDLGKLIKHENNIFMSVLNGLFEGEDGLTIAAYRAGMSSDTLRSWWLGQSIPQTIAEVQQAQTALQISDERLILAYQETTGMALKSYLVERLQAKAKELNRTPGSDEMGKNYPGKLVYQKYFGLWNNALKAAGLDVLHPYRAWTREQSLRLLQKASTTALKCENGIVPVGTRLTQKRYADLANENPDWPKADDTLAKAITGVGSDWIGALAAAGLEAPKQNKSPTRDAAIGILKIAARTSLESENGVLPTNLLLSLLRYDKLAKENDWPSSQPIARAITGIRTDWSGALKAAGLEAMHEQGVWNRENSMTHQRRIWNRENSITHLQLAAVTPLKIENSKVPDGTKLTSARYHALATENPGWPHLQTLAKAITGNICETSNALKAAGLKKYGFLNRDNSIEFLRKAAITPLKNENGKVPDGTLLSRSRYKLLVTENPDWPSAIGTLASVITGKKDDWIGALAAAGLEVPKKNKTPTRDAAINILKIAARTSLKSENGVLPTSLLLSLPRYDKLAKENDWPSSQPIARAITGIRTDWSGAKVAAGVA